MLGWDDPCDAFLKTPSCYDMGLPQHHVIPAAKVSGRAAYSKIMCLVLYRERCLEDKNLLSVQTHKFFSVFALCNTCVTEMQTLVRVFVQNSIFIFYS